MSEKQGSPAFTAEELGALTVKQTDNLREWLRKLVGRNKIAFNKLDEILKQLESKRKDAIKSAAGISMLNGHITLLPVIGKSILGIALQLEMIGVRKTAHTLYNPSLIYDVVKAPDGCYWLVDVEDGRETLGKSPSEAEALIKEQKRSGLMVAEAIALGAHTAPKHCVDATGSRYNIDGCVAGFSRGDEQDPPSPPRLVISGINNVSPSHGSASCLLRM